MKNYQTPDIEISLYDNLDVILVSFTEKDKWDDGGFGEVNGNF